MALKKHITVKASSLIETIVAMIVLVIVFLFSVMIINNVMQTSLLGAKTKATLKMYELLAETKQYKMYSSENITYENFTIDKQVGPKSGNEALLILTFELKNEKGVVIGSIKEEVLAQ